MIVSQPLETEAQMLLRAVASGKYQLEEVEAKCYELTLKVEALVHEYLTQPNAAICLIKTSSEVDVQQAWVRPFNCLCNMDRILRTAPFNPSVDSLSPVVTNARLRCAYLANLFASIVFYNSWATKFCTHASLKEHRESATKLLDNGKSEGTYSLLDARYRYALRFTRRALICVTGSKALNGYAIDTMKKEVAISAVKGIAGALLSSTVVLSGPGAALLKSAAPNFSEIVKSVQTLYNHSDKKWFPPGFGGQWILLSVSGLADVHKHNDLFSQLHDLALRSHRIAFYVCHSIALCAQRHERDSAMLEQLVVGDPLSLIHFISMNYSDASPWVRFKNLDFYKDYMWKVRLLAIETLTLLAPQLHRRELDKMRIVVISAVAIRLNENGEKLPHIRSALEELKCVLTSPPTSHPPDPFAKEKKKIANYEAEIQSHLHIQEGLEMRLHSNPHGPCTVPGHDSDSDDSESSDEAIHRVRNARTKLVKRIAVEQSAIYKLEKKIDRRKKKMVVDGKTTLSDVGDIMGGQK